MNGNAYRDGAVHVMAERCATCIFRPGNLMRLEPGRVKGMIADSQGAESAIICHSTLNLEPQAEAVCRGFFDRYPTAPLQVAERLDMIRWQV